MQSGPSGWNVRGWIDSYGWNIIGRLASVSIIVASCSWDCAIGGLVSVSIIITSCSWGCAIRGLVSASIFVASYSYISARLSIIIIILLSWLKYTVIRFYNGIIVEFINIFDYI